MEAVPAALVCVQRITSLCVARMEGHTLTDAKQGVPTSMWLARTLVQNVLETFEINLLKSNIYFREDQQEQDLVFPSVTLSRTTVSASLSTLSPEKPSSITWKLPTSKPRSKIEELNFTNSANVLI